MENITFRIIAVLSLENITFRNLFKQRAGDRVVAAKIWKSHSIPISTKIRLMKALALPVVTYGCESWTSRKNEETRLGTFGTEKDSAGFMDSKKHMNGFLTKLE